MQYILKQISVDNFICEKFYRKPIGKNTFVKGMTFLSDYGRYLYFGKTRVSFSDSAVKINSEQSLALCVWVPFVCRLLLLTSTRTYNIKDLSLHETNSLWKEKLV